MRSSAVPGGGLFDGRSVRRGVKQAPGCGCVDHAEHRSAIFDQGNIDREFAVTADEFAGAVEWIDQEKTALDRGFRVALRTLFRYHRDMRKPRFEAGDNDRVGGTVGLGDRAFVRLMVDSKVHVIDPHDGCARLQGEGADLFNNCFYFCGVSHGVGQIVSAAALSGGAGSFEAMFIHGLIVRPAGVICCRQVVVVSDVDVVRLLRHQPGA